MSHEWRVGDVYRGPGPGYWRVEQVLRSPVSVFGDNGAGPHTASGLVVLWNAQLRWFVAAPLGDPRLKHLEPIE